MTKRIIFRLSLMLLVFAPVITYISLTKHPSVIHAQVKLAMQDPIPAFTAVFSERIQGKDKPSIESMRVTYMKNAAGAWRYEHQQTAGFQISQVVIRRPDGLMSTMYPDVRTRRTIMAPSTEVALWQSSLFDPKQSCATPIYGTSSPSLPTVTRTEMIQGTLTYKLTTGRAGTTETVWRAPSLGCIEIKRLSEYADNSSTSELQLLSVTFAEPPPIMFEPDQTYEEMKPSDMERHRLKAKFSHLTEVQIQHHLKAYERLDQTYASRHLP